MNKKFKKIISFSFFVVILGKIRPSLAAIITEELKDPKSLNDFFRLAVNFSNLILGLVGSLSLLMFVYGGFSYIYSRGNPEGIKKAYSILTNAVIGLVIVFTSYAIIKVVLSVLGIDWKGTTESLV